MKYWQMDQKDKACDNFANEIGTSQALKFVEIIRKLDDLKPLELRKQLDLFQNSVRKDRETEKLKRNENISTVVYFLVMASAFIVLMNFIIVAFYCDYINLMKYM
jgi:hypothetical protein